MDSAHSRGQSCGAFSDGQSVMPSVLEDASVMGVSAMSLARDSQLNASADSLGCY